MNGESARLYYEKLSVEGGSTVKYYNSWGELSDISVPLDVIFKRIFTGNFKWQVILFPSTFKIVKFEL